MAGMVHVFTHKFCNDGAAAAGLLCRALDRTGIVLRMVSANMEDMPELQLDMGTAYFVDCCPTEGLIARVEAAFSEIYVYDHHISSRALCEKLNGAKWHVVHDLERCATEIVRDEYKITDADLLVEMTAKYDRWTDPSDRVFQWMLAANRMLHDLIVQHRITADLLVRYVNAIIAKTCEDMLAQGKDDMEDVRNCYEYARPGVLEYGARDGWDGRALVLFCDDAAQPSILLHWLLRDHPEFEVAIGVWRKKFESEYRCSVRSRTIDVTEHLPWARGHANAAGGKIDRATLNRATPLGEWSRKRAREAGGAGDADKADE